VISRGRTVAALLAVLAAGLLSRRDAVPDVVEDHAGDALWATAVVLGLALLWPRRPAHMLATAGFVIAVAVELSQLWAPLWLVEFRAHDPVALVLGRGFRWADLLRYAAGCLLGFALLKRVVRPARW